MVQLITCTRSSESDTESNKSNDSDDVVIRTVMTVILNVTVLKMIIHNMHLHAVAVKMIIAKVLIMVLN